MHFTKWLTIVVAILINYSLAGQQSGMQNVLWRNLTPSKDLDIRVLDDFENRIKWNMANSLGIASTTRFVENSPLERGFENFGSTQLENLYRRELQLIEDSALLNGRKFSKIQRYSQEVLVFFSHPGIDYQSIEIPEHERRFVKGRPIAISVWIFGKNKKHTLYALFSNQAQVKIPVKIGDFNFRGWKRLETPIPAAISPRNRINHKVQEFRFDGFKVASHPHEKAGNFSFLYDLVCVLVQTPGDAYPGSKIEDSWR